MNNILSFPFSLRVFPSFLLILAQQYLYNLGSFHWIFQYLLCFLVICRTFRGVS